MIYKVKIEQINNKGARKVVFHGELAGEGVSQVGRIADQVRGGFNQGLQSDGKIVVTEIVWIGGEPKVNEQADK